MICSKSKTKKEQNVIEIIKERKKDRHNQKKKKASK